MRLNTFDSILNRVSYRGKYKNNTVPRTDLKKIMEAGLAAPSGCNKQTTSLIAVDNEDILNQLHNVINPPIGETAPAIICVLTQKVYAYGDKCYNIQDYSAAIENMLLVCTELGYQSCWIEGHITDSDSIGKQMARILDVPDDYELVCILPIGIAADPLIHTNKKQFEERAWFNGFGKEKIR
jgi:nitroreductase